MNKPEISEKVQVIISDAFGIDLKNISESSNIIEDLGADSLDFVELVMRIEDDFDIEISDEVVEKITTVGDMINAIFMTQAIKNRKDTK